MSMFADLHSHILPGVDDGSSSIEQSLEMLQMEAAQGVSQVVLTPHFYAHNDTPEHFLETRNATLEQLRAAMEDTQDLPELVAGAEVYFFPGMSDTVALQNLTIGNSCFILIEMPMSRWTEDMYRELEQIELKQGLIPVIAHIDRYLTPFNRRSICKRLSKFSTLVQANGGFFVNPKTRRTALKMLKKGQIHLLGSDCHDTTHRKPNLDQAMKVISHVDRGLLDWVKSWEADVLK